MQPDWLAQQRQQAERQRQLQEMERQRQRRQQEMDLERMRERQREAMERQREQHLRELERQRQHMGYAFEHQQREEERATRRRLGKELRGVATHVELVPGRGGRPQTLSFRLERRDAHGKRVAPIPAELRGARLRGQLLDGDEVRVVHDKVRGGVLRARRIHNLRTGQTVRRHRGVGAWLGYAIVAAIVAVALILLVVALT